MAKNINDNCVGTWVEIFNIFKELFIASFRWEGLPESINQRFLELALFENGRAVFFKDDILGHLGLKVANAGELNVYSEPSRIRAFGGNGNYQKELTNDKDSVIIYNNFVRDTPHTRIMTFAKRIYNIERTIDINIHAQRTPFLIKTSKKQEFTVRNLYQKYNEFEPLIVVDDDMDMSKLGVIQTNAPFIADKLEEQKRKLWNECLSYIGIENNFSEKNERLTQNEVMISNGLAIACRNSKLQSRQKAVEKINKMFGLQIEVDINNLSILEIEANNATNEGGDVINE
jgi:hypothetical protein